MLRVLMAYSRNYFYHHVRHILWQTDLEKVGLLHNSKNVLDTLSIHLGTACFSKYLANELNEIVAHSCLRKKFLQPGIGSKCDDNF